MNKEALNRLNKLVVNTPDILLQISNADMSKKTSVEKWSKKEILGHLIDSATINHHRLIRAQFQSTPAIEYNQNNWVKFNFYNEIDSVHLIRFWTSYNQQLIEIMKHIPKNHSHKTVRISDEIMSLEFLIADYIAHLEHHIKQIITNK